MNDNIISENNNEVIKDKDEESPNSNLFDYDDYLK